MPKIQQNEAPPEVTIPEAPAAPEVAAEFKSAPEYPGHWERAEKGVTYRLPDGSFIRHN